MHLFALIDILLNINLMEIF